MFEVEEFVNECQAALGETEPRLAMRQVLERALSDPASIAAALPPDKAEIVGLHAADDLTIIKVVWAPGMSVPPHDHRMWAAIGIYAGQEDNAFYRRSPDGLARSGGKELRDRDVLLLGDDAIHSVTNPLRSFTAAIHVYGGDFFTAARSQWNPDTLEEEPYDMAGILQHFDKQNDRVVRQPAN